MYYNVCVPFWPCCRSVRRLTTKSYKLCFYICDFIIDNVCYFWYFTLGLAIVDS